MFTGIINNLASIYNIKQITGKDSILTIKLPITKENNKDISAVKNGDSIAINGICLTIINYFTKDDYLYLDFAISRETINITNFSKYSPDDIVNLEFAAKIGDKISGHMLSGHIDCCAQIVKIDKIDSSYKFTIKITDYNFKKYLFYKASIAIDGISLTINKIEDNIFFINILDYTFKNSNLYCKNNKDNVNIEFEQNAKYIVDFLSSNKLLQ